MAKGSKSPPKARSAKTGYYVKPSFAAKHPNETVIERDKPRKPGPKKK